jgi:hypothetical protein
MSDDDLERAIRLSQIEAERDALEKRLEKERTARERREKEQKRGDAEATPPQGLKQQRRKAEKNNLTHADADVREREKAREHAKVADGRGGGMDVQNSWTPFACFSPMGFLSRSRGMRSDVSNANNITSSPNNITSSPQRCKSPGSMRRGKTKAYDEAVVEEVRRRRGSSPPPHRRETEKVSQSEIRAIPTFLPDTSAHKYETMCFTAVELSSRALSVEPCFQIHSLPSEGGFSAWPDLEWPGTRRNHEQGNLPPEPVSGCVKVLLDERLKQSIAILAKPDNYFLWVSNMEIGPAVLFSGCVDENGLPDLFGCVKYFGDEECIEKAGDNFRLHVQQRKGKNCRQGYVVRSVFSLPSVVTNIVRRTFLASGPAAVYIGEMHRGQRHGLGRIKYLSGNEYAGQWGHNRIQGFGVQRRSDCSRYYGTMVRKHFHGYGLLIEKGSANGPGKTGFQTTEGLFTNGYPDIKCIIGHMQPTSFQITREILASYHHGQHYNVPNTPRHCFSFTI